MTILLLISQVVWRKYSDEHPLTIGTAVFSPSQDISVDHAPLANKQSKWNLLIKNVQMKHAGVYECQISATGIYTHYVALNVLGKEFHVQRRTIQSDTRYILYVYVRSLLTFLTKLTEDLSDWVCIICHKKLKVLW